jgi:hypothetical protein
VKVWHYGEGWKTLEEASREKISMKMRENYQIELKRAHQLREIRALEERTKSDGRLTERDRRALRNEIDRIWNSLASNRRPRGALRV